MEYIPFKILCPQALCLTIKEGIAIIAADISNSIKGCPQLQKVIFFFQLIRFEHTLFALPFAYLGTIIATGGIPDLITLFWVTLAMVGARSGAMGINRIMDLSMDAKNPRTANRHLPKGLLQKREVFFFIFLSLFLFLFATAQLNRLTLFLSPIALFLLIFYSYSKRLTVFTHFILGLTLSCAPIGGYIAVRGALDLEILVLGLAVLFWVAGFDIIYALQDLAFDKKEGIFSIPAIYGVLKSLLLVRVLHFFTFVLLLFFGLYRGYGFYYFLGLFLVGLLLFLENRIMNKGDMKKIEVAFFTMNALLSIILFVFTLLDILLI